MADIGAAALDQMAGQFAAEAFAVGAVDVGRQFEEFLMENSEQRAERSFVAAVGRGGDEHDVAVGTGGDAAEQFESLLAAPAHAAGQGAAVGFVDDHQFRAAVFEVGGASFRFDEVGRDDGEAVAVEDGDADGEIAFESLDGAAEHDFGVDVELLGQFALPLLGQVRRAEDGEPLDFAAIEQFAGDEHRLDRFADANVVGDEQPDRVELQGHHQRDELVGAGLDGDAGEAAERAGGGAGGQAGRFAQQLAGLKVAEVAAGRQGKSR